MFHVKHSDCIIVKFVGEAEGSLPLTKGQNEIK